MAEAVTLSKLHAPAQVDHARGAAAVAGRFADNDLLRILPTTPDRPPASAPPGPARPIACNPAPPPGPASASPDPARPGRTRRGRRPVMSTPTGPATGAAGPASKRGPTGRSRRSRLLAADSREQHLPNAGRDTLCRLVVRLWLKSNLDSRTLAVTNLYTLLAMRLDTTWTKYGEQCEHCMTNRLGTTLIRRAVTSSFPGCGKKLTDSCPGY